MSDRIAEIRELIAEARNLPYYDSGAEADIILGRETPRPLHLRLADALEAAEARLSAITDALDREKLARVLLGSRIGFLAPQANDETRDEALRDADAVRRHVLGEEQN